MAKELDKIVQEIGEANGEYMSKQAHFMDSNIDLTMDTGKRDQDKQPSLPISVGQKSKIVGDRGDLL